MADGQTLSFPHHRYINLLLSVFYFFLAVEDCCFVITGSGRNINLKLFVFQPIIFLATKVLDTGPLLAESQYYFTENSGQYGLHIFLSTLNEHPVPCQASIHAQSKRCWIGLPDLRIEKSLEEINEIKDVKTKNK